MWISQEYWKTHITCSHATSENCSSKCLITWFKGTQWTRKAPEFQLRTLPSLFTGPLCSAHICSITHEHYIIRYPSHSFWSWVRRIRKQLKDWTALFLVQSKENPKPKVKKLQHVTCVWFLTPVLTGTQCNLTLQQIGLAQRAEKLGRCVHAEGYSHFCPLWTIERELQNPNPFVSPTESHIIQQIFIMISHCHKYICYESNKTFIFKHSGK